MLPGKLYSTRVPASDEPLVAESKYSLWIPIDTPVVRTIFAINQRGAGKHLFYKDREWRAMAARNAAAMMYCQFEAHEVRNNGYGLSMLAACDQFAEELNRPELKHAPFILWGHSMGGRVAQDFARFKPSRMLAFHLGLRANPSTKEFMEEKEDAAKVPGLYLMGENDTTPTDIREHFVHARKRDAPRAWILLPGQTHWPKGMGFHEDKTTLDDWRAWAANDIVIPWTEAIIARRFPNQADPRKGPIKLIDISIEDGWMGDVTSGRVAPSPTYQGNKAEASWFPNEVVANAWVDYSRFEQQTTTTNDNSREAQQRRQRQQAKQKVKANRKQGRLSVNPLFTDHMVLQQGPPIPIWGEAPPGQIVQVSFDNQQQETEADQNGRWQVQLKPLIATSEGRRLTIHCNGDQQNLTDVVVGEVWVCSGQSNMQCSMKQTEDGKTSIASAKHPLLRIYHRASGERVREHWQACTPENIADFSAVAYFFGRHLQNNREVPVGLIVRAVGGTTIQRWTSPRHWRTNALIDKLAEEAIQRSDEFDKLETEKSKYDKRNQPTADQASWIAEMTNLTYYRNIGGLYERMIKPLQPFAIRGVIWYQGEFNNRNRQAFEYREWQENLVDGWRKEWGQGDFPFLFVQMQGLGNTTTALLRESQATTLKRCSNTAMAVICDESVGLHPERKQIAGDRLAIAALNLAYGAAHSPMGPTLNSFQTIDGKAVLSFDMVDDGLVCKGEQLTGFFVCGADKEFRPANAKITGTDQVTVWHDEITVPVAVRYAWLNTPRGHMNLYNSDGLPATPFRTDDWANTESLHSLLPNPLPATKNKPRKPPKM